ncbi:alpha/beta hydrolase [Antrihabitans sp. YC3-6]|uniref:Alpha/beta hydrolase n=1 Tax=Antrihabitans stalagmiti TaxID=2799499 RepID=A0A934NLZ7_9NOCA|nr:alpha/beta hydrolase [Antrihabitans stalagmiti]MBJ8337686.1 alpha/beta hydrolase [Antrihabitans stalagmiti]
MITETRVCHGGVHTRVLSVQGDGTPVVLLHGYADSADTWRALLALFDNAGRAAIAVDLPGFGKADRRAAGPILPQLDSFIDALLEESDRPLVLMGNSLGACVSVRAAARRPNRVEAVITVDEPILADHWVARYVRRRRAPRLPSLLLAGARVPRRPLEYSVELVFKRLLYSEPSAADPAVIARWVESVPDSRALAGLANGAIAVARETRTGYSGMTIECPTLIVHGAKDVIIPVASSRMLHALIPNSELVVMPKSGHCPQLDDPAGLAEIVLPFLSNRAGAGR